MANQRVEEGIYNTLNLTKNSYQNTAKELLHKSPNKKTEARGLPGGQWLKDCAFQCRGHSFNPWSGS